MSASSPLMRVGGHLSVPLPSLFQVAANLFACYQRADVAGKICHQFLFDNRIGRLSMFRIIFLGVGCAIVAMGALIVAAQTLEWWNYGNWNPVTLRYVFVYFFDSPARFAAVRGWNLPLSGTLVGAGALVATVGILKR
jgi:hypothetical protein